MKHPRFVLSFLAILCLSACGLFKFGVGEVQNESEYKSVCVLDNGQTLLFTYTDRRVKHEPIGLGWEKRTIYLRDNKFLCAYDLASGKTRILLELTNRRDAQPHGDLALGRPFGNKVLIQGRWIDRVQTKNRQRLFLFDGDRYKLDPRQSLTEITDLPLKSNSAYSLVAPDGTLLINKLIVTPEGSHHELSLRKPDGQVKVVGLTKKYPDFSCDGVVCFRDLDTLTWRAVDPKSGSVTPLSGSPTAHYASRPVQRVSAVKRPEHNSDRILVWHRKGDGSFTEMVIHPHVEAFR